MAQATQRRVGDVPGRGDRVHAEGRAGSRPGSELARRHVATPRRNWVRQDNFAGLAGARRDQARDRCHLHRSQGRRLRSRAAASAAARAGRRFRAWDPQGKTIYNPYDRGSNTEIADKLLAAEVFTEPHYQRLAQRYIGHVVRALRLAGVPVSLATVVEHMHSGRLASLTRKMSSDRCSPAARVPRDADAAAGAGSRGRPRPARDPRRVRRRSSAGPSDRRSTNRSPRIARPRRRRPLPARGRSATAGSSDARRGDRPGSRRDQPRASARRAAPGLVVIDEYSAFGAPQTQRLFGRGRGAWLSQLLGTQEVADLGSSDTNVLGAGRRDAGPDGREHRGAPMRPTEHARLGGAGGRDRRHTWSMDHHPADARSGRRSADRIGLTIARPGVRHPSGHDQEPRRRRVRGHRTSPRAGRVVRVFHPDELRRRGVEC